MRRVPSAPPYLPIPPTRPTRHRLARYRFVAALLLLATLASLALAACGSSDTSEDAATATASPTASGTATPSGTATATPEPIDSLADADFTDPALIGPLIDAAGGGEVPPERVQLVDLIPDNGPDDGANGALDEAVAVVESGGTLGDLGAGIFALIDGQPELVQFIPAAGRVEIRLDLVVTIEGVWAAGDPQCCPSQLRETSYQWDGARFAPLTEQLVPNPD